MTIRQDALKALIKDKFESQLDFAEAMCMTQPQLSLALSGRSVLSDKKLKRFLYQLDITVGEFEEFVKTFVRSEKQPKTKRVATIIQPTNEYALKHFLKAFHEAYAMADLETKYLFKDAVNAAFALKNKDV